MYLVSFFLDGNAQVYLRLLSEVESGAPLITLMVAEFQR
jgi:hypothetical protein